jgi:hypothetical protein
MVNDPDGKAGLRTYLDTLTAAYATLPDHRAIDVGKVKVYGFVA